jgi:uncharacterized membrane protein YsdA (DUF1294 family)
MDGNFLIVVAGLYACVSAATFVVFAWDKSAAKRDRRRVPEAFLHGFELLGGFPGSLLAMKFLRHKNRKPSFYFVTWVIALMHAGAWGAVLFRESLFGG